jgi:uncharacterized membrane protein YfcA
VAVTLLLAAGGLGAGVFGALLGLGGGILIVPLLTLAFGLPFREAVAVSLLAVITTSSASAAVYLERGVANLRLGMTLELLTATGALAGGLLAFMLDERLLAGIFAVMLVYVAVSMARRRGPGIDEQPPDLVADPAADAPPPANGFAATLGGPDYAIRRLPLGLALSAFAGLQSALLGVGGGIVKVPAMHLAMGVPLRVATATSNLMIGITASASAIIYLFRGGLDPYVAGPTAIGVFVGASLGSRIAHRVDVRLLRFLFTAVLLYTAYQMLLKALG